MAGYLTILTTTSFSMRILRYEVSNVSVILGYALHTEIKINGYHYTYIYKWKKKLYAFFWAIPRRLKFICRRFGTLCIYHLPRQVGVCTIYTHLPAYEGGTECSETSVYKLQTPGYCPEESIEHSEHGESLKSRKKIFQQKTKCNTTPLIFWNHNQWF